MFWGTFVAPIFLIFISASTSLCSCIAYKSRWHIGLLLELTSTMWSSYYSEPLSKLGYRSSERKEDPAHRTVHMPVFFLRPVYFVKLGQIYLFNRRTYEQVSALWFTPNKNRTVSALRYRINGYERIQLAVDGGSTSPYPIFMCCGYVWTCVHCILFVIITEDSLYCSVHTGCESSCM